MWQGMSAESLRKTEVWKKLIAATRAVIPAGSQKDLQACAVA